jgi:predicted deacylase
MVFIIYPSAARSFHTAFLRFLVKTPVSRIHSIFPLAIQALSAEGHPIDQKALATISPYLTRHLKRYGDYVVDLHNIPQPLEEQFTYLSKFLQARCSKVFIG